MRLLWGANYLLRRARTVRLVIRNAAAGSIAGSR